MMTLTEFKQTLNMQHPPDEFAVQLKSLWYDGKGDWQRAHATVDHLTDRDSAWVHAYLHRKEGDTWNADYWYNRAGKTRLNITLEDEWEGLVAAFLGKGR